MKDLEYFSTRLPGDLKRYIKILAAMDQMKVQELVEDIFTQYVNEKKKEGKI